MSEKELTSPPTHIAFVKSSVEVLWEMEQSAKQTQSRDWPVFPMTFEDQRYTIGLLWLNEKRPDDNREQAFSSAAHQLCAASVAQWLVLSLSERKVVGSNPPMVVHTPCRSPRLAPGYLANAR